MTQTLPLGRGAARTMPHRLTMLVAAVALVLAGLSASARPAKADNADDILRFLAGALVVGAIIHAIDDNATPAYTGRWSLPDGCLETIRVNGRNIDAYNARCLNRAGYDNLPRNCRYEFRVNNGRTRTGYIAECLYEAGYTRHSGGWNRPQPFPMPQPHWDNYPYGSVQPGRRPPHGGQWQQPGYNARLPQQCAMHFRLNGSRTEGYWADCLSGAGFFNLPGFCLFNSVDGQRIYNAECLRQAGYR